MMIYLISSDHHLWYLNESNEWHLRFKVKNLEKQENDNIALNWTGE